MKRTPKQIIALIFSYFFLFCLIIPFWIILLKHIEFTLLKFIVVTIFSLISASELYDLITYSSTGSGKC